MTKEQLDANEANDNADTLGGMLDRMDEFKMDPYGNITDADEGEWTADQLTAAIEVVRERVAELEQLAKFAAFAKQLGE